MAVSSTSAAENSGKGKEIRKIPSEPPKRTKDPGVRVIGGRIYDSANGKTCHQCRQKTLDFTVSCRKLKKDKLCSITFCHKCLLNRYGEKAAEVEKLGDWICPRCRGVCNCSFCMKKKGFQPTGMLVQTAKATGFSSVFDLLRHKGSEVLEPRNVAIDLNASPKSSPLPKKGLTTSKRCRDKENYCVELNEGEPKEAGLGKEKERKKGSKKLKTESGNENERHKEVENHSDCNGVDKETIVNGEVKPPKKVNKKRKISSRALSKTHKENIVLPQGSLLTTVAGIELPSEDIGAALQFLEFCSVFSKVLCLKKGQPEHLLRELTRERVRRRGVNSSLLQFHVKLLSLIKKDMGKGSSWVKALEKCIKGSQCILDEFPMDFPIKDSFCYDDLEPSQKLKLMNFLCDESLGTEKLRNWIDKENTKFDEERKKNKEKLLEARRKEKCLKQQLKDEMAKSVLSMRGGAPLSLSEYNDLISQIRTEADKAHAEMLETINLLPENKQRSDVVRTEPTLLEGNGHVYWKLRSYNGNSNIILQDIGQWDVVTLKDKWYTYDEEQEKVVEKHVSTLRNYRLMIHRPWEKNTSAERNDADNSETQNCFIEGSNINGSSTGDEEIEQVSDV